jgi:dTDP-4-amino-4,6-dideoxygalactose transaminase
VTPSRQAVIFGARRDGSAKVLLDIIALGGECEVVGFLDDNAGIWGQKLEGVPIVGGRDAFRRLREQDVSGGAFAVRDNCVREQVLEDARAAGLCPLTAVHPTAVAHGVALGEGVWIAAGATVNPGTTVGGDAVINTGAMADHDCRIGAYANTRQAEQKETARMPAILGDAPALGTVMNIVRPVMPDLSEFEVDFRACLVSGQVTNNSQWVVEFERRIREFLGVEHALVFCNGETALICMLKAAQLDGEVIVPSYTFSGTVHAAIWTSLRPIFADIDRASFTISPAAIEESITPRTSAILAAPVYGNPCDNEALQELADRRGLTLLYDSASGFGCTCCGRRLGGFGKAEIFSFHATKVFGTMEGGALTTNDPELYERARLLRGFGQIGAVDCGLAGLNGKMMEVAALVGLRALDKFDAVLEHRSRIEVEYDRLLAAIPGVCLQRIAPGNTSSRLYQAFRLDPDAFGLSRDELIEALRLENITARKFLDPPVHRMTYYRQTFGDVHLPVTEAVAASAVALPFPSNMMFDEVRAIGGAVASLQERAPAVRLRLAPVS